MRHLIFALVLLVGMGGLTFTVVRLVRFMWSGRPGIPVDRVPERLGSVVLYWLLQRKVMERPTTPRKLGFTSLHHLGIFWGFLVVTLGTVELWANGLVGLSFTMLPSAIYRPLEWSIDVFNLIVLVAIGYGFFRRLVIKPRLIPMSLDAGIILSAIAGLMITHFFFHAFHMVATQTVGEEGPVSTVVAGWFASMPVDTAATASEVLWWTHIVPRPRVPQLPALLEAHPPARRAAEHLLPQPRAARRHAQAQPRGRERLGRRQDRAVLAGSRCIDSTRAPSARAARTTARRTTPRTAVADAPHPRHARRDDRARAAAAEDRAHRGADGAQQKADGASSPGAHGVATPSNPEAEAAASGHNKDASENASGHPLGAMLDARARRSSTSCRRWSAGASRTRRCGRARPAAPARRCARSSSITRSRSCRCARTSCSPSRACRRSWRAPSSNLEQNSNPWGIAADKRMDWAEGLERPDHRDATRIPSTSCSSAAPARSTIASRRRCARWSRCCTPPASTSRCSASRSSASAIRRAARGNEYLFQTQAEANVDGDQRREDAQGDRVVPALLPHHQERVPAVRRQVRGHPPLAAARAPPRREEARAASIRWRRS